MIYAESLIIDYPGRRALKDFSIQVSAGSAHALVGTNGSGKSTALLGLAGLLPFAGGRVRIAGYELPAQARQARRHLGVLAQDPGLVEVLTLRENLELAAEAHGIKVEEFRRRVGDLIEALRLQEALAMHPSQLSFGTAKKAGLVLALLHAPQVLLLDEPFEGLDPLMVPALVELLDRLRQKGAAILFTTHTMETLQGWVQEVTQLEGGLQSSPAIPFPEAIPPAFPALPWLA